MYERDEPPFCGLHGRERTDPDKWGLDYAECGYRRRVEARQLELFV
jgi:hypothetical protein